MGNALIASRSNKRDFAAGVIPDYLAEKARKLIDERHVDIQGVDDVCAVLGISASYLRQIFSDSFGISVKSYITSVKIEKARSLLKSGNVSVGDIAKAVGYRHTVTFEKAFKKVVGVPPSKYRGGGDTGDFYRRK